ncbi:copper homeostasis protein CutC [Sphingomonas sp. BGYR3]|uniref:copper homeostasis protein CutC n=1 Tax=Sphingomonas sp. BGYR3 TaxID=2975483 RepID=UPI0021A698D7|nr:copper homeostasis protein CutC [Sphingomonas sp. BGYR3]
MSRIQLEICVDGLDGAQAAIDGGADRIELCSALALGGLTPSIGLASLVVPLAQAAGVRVHAMVRPRGGDFVYSPAERRTLMAEAAGLIAAGVDGLVFGALDGAKLDDGLLAEFVGAARRGRPDLTLALHRAVDLLPDPVEAVDMAARLGFDHILTSGGAERAIDSLPVLRSMVMRAGDRIGILPGSGIRADNARRILIETGASQLHASASMDGDAPDPRVLALGFASGPPRITSVDAVRNLRKAIDA